MSADLSSDPYNSSLEQLLALRLLSQRRVSDATDLEALVQRADWKRLLRFTSVSLHPFLHFALNESAFLDLVPPEARATLEQSKTDAVIRYMRRRTELHRVFTLFNEDGIEAVVLKGASLAESVYPLPYLRPMRDVDLWIPEAQMARAHSLLEADGYREKHVPYLDMNARYGKEIRLAKLFNYDLLVIEIHSTLDIHLPSDNHEMNAIWNRCIEHPGFRAKNLHPRDMLHHLCMHLALRHRFEQGLLWLLDIRLLVEEYCLQMEWNELAEESRRQQTSKYVYICLEMVADLLGCSVAEAAFAKLEAPNDVRSVKSLAWRQIWYSDFAVLPPRRVLMLLTSGTPGKMVGSVVHRIHKYLTSNSPDDRQPNGSVRKLSSVLQWAVEDLRRIYSAFRKGAFSRANLQKACEMEIRRTEFEKRIQA